jgi:ABC-type glycerol-3-phosphate transport system permease component
LRPRKSRRRTWRAITPGLAFLVTEQNLMFEPGRLMATCAVASVPLVVFFLITMKPFVRGLAGGALKE